MRSEESLLFSDSLPHWDLVDDIFLSTVFYTDKTETQLNLLVHDHLLGVSTTVHNINLGDNTDGTDALGVELTRHLKTI